MMKNILLLIPNLNTGGAQRVFHDHSIELSKQFKIYECVFNLKEGHAFKTGNEIIDLEVPAGENIIGKIYYFYLRCKRVRKIKRQYKIDYCISHLEGADYVNILSRYKEKIILCIHGSKSHDENISGIIGWVRKKILIPKLYNKSDRIVTVSEGIRKELISSFGILPVKIKVVYNFFYIKKIEELAKGALNEKYEELFSMSPTIITVGRLTLQKNQKPLLHIFRKLVEISPAKLVFVGDGELRSELINEALSLGLLVYDADKDDYHLGYQIYFLGNQVSPFPFIINATLFILSSAWEGFPMAIGEAMSCSIPVVSSDCPTGPREILAPGLQENVSNATFGEYGVLLPIPKVGFPTINIWTSTIKQLLDDDLLRKKYRMKGYSRVHDFSVESIMIKWFQLLDELR